MIIGNGAIGTLWAHHLTKAGHFVTLVGRKPRVPTQKYSLLTLDGNTITHTMAYLQSSLPASIDLAVVTTKAYQIAEAITPYLPQLSHCPIILMHNGLGCIEQLSIAPTQKILLATTSHAALVRSNGIEHTGLGSTMLGRYQGISKTQAQQIAELLNHALPEVELIDDIEMALWKKLAINCAINPLTALNNCTNGALAQDKYQPCIDSIVYEISNIISVMQLNLTYSVLRQTVDTVIANTAKNYSSMHQDITHQRQTEIEHINGYVVAKGKELGIATPENKRLWLAIKALSSA